MDVTVVEAGGQLMPAQLDEEAGQMLKRTMEAMGITVVVNGRTKRVREENGKITGLEFQDGTAIDADMVVISAGIRPITEIAQVSGITVNKGIVCDDQMRTNVPEVFALGECVEHRGKIYGLVEPIWEQARVLADVITGTNLQARYEGSKTATKLKVMGVELVSIGAKDAEKPSDELVVYRELKRNIYKKWSSAMRRFLARSFWATLNTRTRSCGCSWRSRRSRRIRRNFCSAPFRVRPS